MILTIQDQEEFFSFPFDDNLIMQVSSTDSDMLLVSVYTNNKGMPERSFFGDDSGITIKDYKFMTNAIKEAYKQKSKHSIDIINLNELFELEKKKAAPKKDLDILFDANKTEDTPSDSGEEDDEIELDDYEDVYEDDDDYDFSSDLLDI